MRSGKKSLRQWLRELHRDIGYFAVGMSLVYALSGFFLSHKNVFTATRTESAELSLATGMDLSEFRETMDSESDVDLTHSRLKGEYISFYFEGGEGDYHVPTGRVQYERYFRRGLMLFINQLHLNQRKGWVAVADVFSFLLVFLALSGLVMVRGRKGFLTRGIWFMLLGFILILIFIWIQ
ncbi:MAG: PepSY-associated TM helix domain-containing protein [Bacteroidales bacterium]|nr:PepSY-associated TM helix domain-containing protein [Bacteroidales bacterium]